MFYFMDESDRQDDDPTQQEILERCTQIRKEKQNDYTSYDPSSFERGVAKLLQDVHSLPITYLRFYDW